MRKLLLEVDYRTCPFGDSRRKVAIERGLAPEGLEGMKEEVAALVKRSMDALQVQKNSQPEQCEEAFLLSLNTHDDALVNLQGVPNLLGGALAVERVLNC